MSKRMVLTVTDEMYLSLETSAKKLGITPLEYIRYLLMKDNEAKDGKVNK